MKMFKEEKMFIAVFKDGHTLTATTENGYKNRLDFYNWICENALGRGHKGLERIETWTREG